MGTQRVLNAGREDEGIPLSTKWLGILAFLALVLVFGLTSPNNRFEADDALDYARAVEGQELPHLISKHHLAYLPIAKVVSEGAQSVGLADRSLPTLVWMGAAFAAAAAVLFVCLLRNWLQVPWRLAIFGGGALASSYGFWRYAGEIEVYALAALTAIILLIAATQLKSSGFAVFGIAILCVAAVLGHVLNLALVVALPYLLLKRGWSPKHLLATAATGLSIAVPILWGVYLLATGDEPVPRIDFVDYWLEIGTSSQINAIDIAFFPAVIASLVVASNSIFLYQPTRGLVSELFPNRALADEFYTGSTAADWLRWAAPVALVIAIGAVIALASRLDWSAVIRSTEGRFLGLWILLYIGLTILGQDITQPEVLLLLLTPLWTAVVLGLRHASVSSGFLIFAIGALVLNSLIGGLGPLYSGRNRHADLTSWLENNTSGSDLVLTTDSAGLARYIAYHHPPHVAHIGPMSSDAIAVEFISELGRMIGSGATTQSILRFLEDQHVLLGSRPIAPAEGELYITRELFNPPLWLQNQRPKAAAELVELQGELGGVFRPVPGSDYFMIRTETSG